MRCGTKVNGNGKCSLTIITSTGTIHIWTMACCIIILFQMRPQCSKSSSGFMISVAHVISLPFFRIYSVTCVQDTNSLTEAVGKGRGFGVMVLLTVFVTGL